MPATPRFNFKRNRYHPYEGSSNTKTNVPRSVVFKKDVASIAKKVAVRTVRSASEKKHLNINRDDVTMFYTFWYYTDPMQFIVQGTGDGQRVGFSLSDVWLKLSFNFCHTPTNWNGTRMRILVVRADQELPNAASVWVSTPGPTGSFPNLISNDFQQSSAGTIGHDYVILKDTYVKSERQYNTPTYGTPGRTIKWVKLGKMTYRDTATGGVNYQKFKNVYIIVGCSNPGTTPLDAAGVLQFSGEIYWRDS